MKRKFFTIFSVTVIMLALVISVFGINPVDLLYKPHFAVEYRSMPTVTVTPTIVSGIVLVFNLAIFAIMKKVEAVKAKKDKDTLDKVNEKTEKLVITITNILKGLVITSAVFSVLSMLSFTKIISSIFIKNLIVKLALLSFRTTFVAIFMLYWVYRANVMKSESLTKKEKDIAIYYCSSYTIFVIISTIFGLFLPVVLRAISLMYIVT